MTMIHDEKSRFDTPLIWLNGHVATSSLEASPEVSAKFCQECGSETISTCPACSASIRGYHDIPGWIGGEYDRPNYCHNCGKPYPWTAGKLRAAKELTDQSNELSSSEKVQLKEGIDQIVRDTPEGRVRALRTKSLIEKSGKQAASMFRDILVDIASESIKKIIWPQ